MKWTKPNPYLALLIALILYGGLSLYQLDLPGLHHDEAQEAGLMAMQLNNGLPPTLFRDTGVVFANRAFPIMVQDYIGALNVYFAWIAFGIGGVNVESLRVMTVVIGMITIIMAYGATRRLAGSRAAAMTALFLAVQPTFIFWMRQGVFVTSYIQPLALASLWLMLRWRQGGHHWNLWLAAFLMGAGLWGKLLFIWFMAGMIGAWLLVNLPRILRWLRHRDTLRPGVTTSPVSFLIALPCFLIGIAPLIYYNLESGGTLDNLFNNLDQSYYGVDNDNIGENLQTRFKQAPEVFESGQLWELGGQFPHRPMRLWLYFTGAECLVAALMIRKRRGARLFIVLLVLLMIAQSIFTSTALWHTHFALILPFMVMMGAVGLFAAVDVLVLTMTDLPPDSKLARSNPVGKAVRYSMITLTAALLVFEMLTVLRYHHALEESGGLGPQTSAIYELTDELASLPYLTPVAALDWGISPQVAMLTQNDVVPNEVFGYTWEPDPGFEARLAPFLALDDSVYVLHAEGQTVYPRREALFDAAAAAGRELELYQIIRDRSGTPIFEVWRSPAPTTTSGSLIPPACPMPAECRGGA